MAEIWDKIRSELDKAGKVAQDAIDEGKLRIELFRVRQAADKTAQALGYVLFRARQQGRDPDPEAYSRLFSTLAEQEAEVTRIQTDLKRASGDDSNTTTESARAPSDAPPEA